MNKLTLAAAIVVACGIALYGGWKLRDWQDVPADPAAADGSLDDRPDMSRRPVGSPAVGMPLESGPERAARIAAMREESRTRTRATVAAGKRSLETAFNTETPNPAWARGKEQELERFVVNPQMEAIDAVPTNFDVECRSSTCRIQADFATPSAADDWATLYLTNNGGLLPRATLNKARQPDGTVKITMLGATR